MKMRKKIEILNKAPQVSKSEIESYMDFDAVLDQYNDVKATATSQFLKGTLIFVGVVLLGITAYYFIGNQGNDTASEVEVIAEKEVSKAIETDSPPVEQLENIAPSKIEDSPLSRKTETEKETPTKQITTVVDETKEVTENENLEEKKAVEEAPYVYVEASPVEGLTYLYAYFRENLTYPDELRKDSIEGVVLISFTILKDSTVSNVNIVQSLGEKFDNEALRVINNMPKWIPATVNDTPVNSKLSIPLTFNIQK